MARLKERFNEIGIVIQTDHNCKIFLFKWDMNIVVLCTFGFSRPTAVSSLSYPYLMYSYTRRVVRDPSDFVLTLFAFWM